MVPINHKQAAVAASFSMLCPLMLGMPHPPLLQGLVGLGSVSDYVAHHAPCTGEWLWLGW